MQAGGTGSMCLNPRPRVQERPSGATVSAAAVGAARWAYVSNGRSGGQASAGRKRTGRAGSSPPDALRP